MHIAMQFGVKVTAAAVGHCSHHRDRICLPKNLLNMEASVQLDEAAERGIEHFNPIPSLYAPPAIIQ